MTIARSTLLIFPLLLGLQQSPSRDAAPAPPPTGTASLAGAVITDDAAGQPVKKARVTLNSTDGAVGVTTTSDESGRFLFRNLPARRYVVQVSKAAWLNTAYGARRPGRPGTPIAVADGQRVTGITVKLARGAVVSGTVRDRQGQPAVGVRVQAMRLRMQDGARFLDGAGAAPALTDDTGTYRIYGLAPADVLVAVTMLPISAVAASDAGDFRLITPADVAQAMQIVQQGSSGAAGVNSRPGIMLAPGVKYASVFYPAATDPATATIVPLAAGEERTDIDITMQLVPTARVTGAVTGLDGAPLARGTVVAISGGIITTLGVGMAGFAMAEVTQSGEYQLGGLAPGPYTIAAGGITGWAKAEIDLNGQDQNVSLRLQPGVSLRGRVLFDGATTSPASASLRVGLNGIDPFSQFIGRAVAATIRDGAFSFDAEEIIPGQYRLRLDGIPAGWYTKSAVANGRDVLDGVLDIQPQDRVTDVALTLTNRPSELAGSLRDATGGASPEYFIIVFSADRAHWTPYSRRILQTRPANDGAFSLKGLPAGDYYIAALTDVEPDEWFSPAFLESVVGAAVKVTIVDGQRTVQDLEIRKF